MKVSSLLFIAIAAASLSARAAEPVVVGMGALTCEAAVKTMQNFDLQRDQDAFAVRAMIERTKTERKEEAIKEMMGPVLERYSLKKSAYRDRFSDYALGMLQTAILNGDKPGELLKLKNYNFVDAFFRSCEALQHDAYGTTFFDFVERVISNRPDVLWNRPIR